MKKSELKNLIREEIKKILKEGRFDLKYMLDLFSPSMSKRRTDITVFAKGQEYGVNKDGLDPSDPNAFFGTTKDGKEKELKFSDIEFITANGRRIAHK